jgi:N-acetylglucosaminyldiphosphoundecaprenol N-acetyl-beta-D-mannosaminyltransferase
MWLASVSWWRVTERIDILGVRVSAIDMETALDTVDHWVRRRERRYICVTGVHGIMESQRDARLKDIHNRAGLVTPDGMPLVWISHMMGFKQVARVYGPDLMLAVCKRSGTAGYRHFFFGGAPGVAETLVTVIRKRFPGIRIAGAFSPSFQPLLPDEIERAVRIINAACADIVWVGFGTPKQEQWMDSAVGLVNAPVLIGCGAAFDFLSGTKPQAPRWMQRSGLEWTFRLMTEPRRLWRRYLIGNSKFVWLMFLQALARRRPSLNTGS